MFDSIQYNRISMWEKFKLLFHRSKTWKHDSATLTVKVMNGVIYVLAEGEGKDV